MTSSKPSLQRRLLVGVLGLVAAVWLGMALFTWFDVRHELDELLDSHLAQSAALLVARQIDDLEHGEDDNEHRAIDAPSLHRYAPKVAFEVWHEGRLALRSAAAPPLGGESSAGFIAGFQTRQIAGNAWRVFSTEGAERDIQVHVAEQVSSRTHILESLVHGMLWPLALGLPLLALVGWWAVRRGLAPLRTMDTALSARDPAALQPVVLRDTPAEMAPMVDTLNRLFERIVALMETERRFTADAAHELRTPIAAIRTQAQVALGATDDASRRHALQGTLEGCDRAARLIEQLLTLSRLEAAEQTAAGRVDLVAVTREVAAELAARAIDKKQTLELRADNALPVPADDALLRVLVRNLIDNAVRYSPQGATIHVEVNAPGGRPSLVVDDSGPGLSEADLARLGERFFRALGHDESGSGLGWSIVRRVARVLGAQVQAARSSTLGGLRVSVQWPGAAQP